MKIPLRLHDWSKVKKTGRGYTWRELTAVKLLRELAADSGCPRSLLNIGFHDYQDRRNRWWIDICRANGIDWHILEVHAPNVERFQQQAPVEDHHRITRGNLLDIDTIFTRRFDVILHWHGPEHLVKEDYLAALPALENTTSRLLILGCPNGYEEQGQAYNNPHEEHRSSWTVDDFSSLGYTTELVEDKKCGHITASKRFG